MCHWLRHMSTCRLLAAVVWVTLVVATGAFPWHRTPTMMLGNGMSGRFVRQGNMSGTGRLDDRVVRFLADHYDVIVAGDDQPGLSGCLEPKIKEFADRIAAVNSDVRVLVYNANQIHHGMLVPPGGRPDSNYLCGLDGFDVAWIATADDGSKLTVHNGKQYVHNLSNPECRRWWIGVITNRTLGDNVHGVFADNGLDSATAYADQGLGKVRGEALLRGQQLLLEEARAAGLWVIFNGIRFAATVATPTRKSIVRDDYDALRLLLPYADAGYHEPWLSGAMYRNVSTGRLDEARVTHGLLTMINASRTQPAKGIVFKAGPGPCVGYVAGLLGCTWPYTNGSNNVPNGWNGTCAAHCLSGSRSLSVRAFLSLVAACVPPCHISI